MKLTFLGTRANIDVRSQHHDKHSVLAISEGEDHRGTSIWIDCGKDWQDSISSMRPRPEAIFLTHGHEDHAEGLKHQTPTHVYATEETWDIIEDYAIPEHNRHIIEPGDTITKGNHLSITPYNVFHSIHAPAIGYKISNGTCTIFYVSDLAKIEKPEKALDGVHVYIGDGSIIDRDILLRENAGQPTGHASIEDQLSWCADYGVTQAIFTHCGTEIVSGKTEDAQSKIQTLGEKYGVTARLAYDGMTLTCAQDIVAGTSNESQSE